MDTDKSKFPSEQWSLTWDSWIWDFFGGPQTGNQTGSILKKKNQNSQHHLGSLYWFFFNDVSTAVL